MTTLEQIRQTGAKIAFENEIFGKEHLDNTILPNALAEDFIKRMVTDFFEFNTLEQFDYTHLNLFSRAFMYSYGKGAEIALFTRLGNSVPTINYEFDKAMEGICGEGLSDHLRLCINKKSSTMLDMYLQMFQHTRGSQEKVLSENVSFEDCISTILNGAFFCGFEIGVTTELTEKDTIIKYQENQDTLYNYDSYDQKYKIDDYKMFNY